MGFRRLAWFVLAAMAAVFLLDWRVRRPAETPVLRGGDLAGQQGCFACHGPGGSTGSPNPGGESDVPAWIGGTAMMYLKSDSVLREYIVEGRRLGEERPPGLLRMPAYGSKLSEKEIRDLMAYVKAVSQFYPGMPVSARVGMEAAQDAGCFGCHGPSGRGGVRNPGSFKGVIAGWDDPAFGELARDSAEVGEWMRRGTLRRLERHWVAGFFLRRQRLQMPAYDTALTDSQMASIQDYIRWMRDGAR